jgi:hypothetical protein
VSRSVIQALSLRPALVLVPGAVVMLALLLFVSRWMTFWGDEWVVIYDRHDVTPSTLLTPFVDALVAVPVVVYAGLLRVFGLTTYLPYLAVSWIAHLVCVVLIYRIVERRCGPYVGAAAGLSVLFLGSAWEVLFHAFQMQYVIAAALGLLAIDLLDVDELGPQRAAGAAVALVLAVASSNVGPLFVGVILVWLALRGRRSLLLITAPAIAVYGTWYIATREQRDLFAFPSVLDAIAGMLIGVGSPVVGILGLPPARFAVVGTAIAIAVVAIAVVATVRGWRPDPLALAGAAGVVVEFGLSAVLRGEFGIEHGIRSGYVYPGAIFAWLAIAGLIARPVRPSRRWALVGAATVALAILGNMRQFAGAAVGDREVHATEVAGLRLIEQVAADPRADLDARSAAYAFHNLFPREYLAAVARYGRPDVAFDWRTEVNQAELEDFRRRLLPGG